MYGIKKLAPPHLAQIAGNRQTFPNPTAEAMHDIRNCVLLPHVSRPTPDEKDWRRMKEY